MENKPKYEHWSISLTTVSLQLLSGRSARSELQQSRWETKSVYTGNWVWVSTFYTEQICNSSCSSWLSRDQTKRRSGPEQLRLCHCDWRLLLNAGFLRGEQQLSLVKVNQEVFGRSPSGDFQLENWRYATQPVYQGQKSKGQRCHGNDGGNYGTWWQS